MLAGLGGALTPQRARAIVPRASVLKLVVRGAGAVVRRRGEEVIQMGSDTALAGDDDVARLQAEVARLASELAASQQRETALLEQQTATAEVLRVIATSPTDRTPCSTTILAAAARLCQAPEARFSSFVSPMDIWRPASTTASIAIVRGRSPMRRSRCMTSAGVPATRDSVAGRAFVEQRTIHVPDMVEAVASEYPASRESRVSSDTERRCPRHCSGGAGRSAS